MFGKGRPLSCQVDLVVPAPSQKNPDPNGFVVIGYDDTMFTSAVRIQSDANIPGAALYTILFVGQGPIDKSNSPKFDPMGASAAASVHRKPIYKSVKQIWTSSEIKAGTHDYPVTVDVESNVPPTITDPTVSDIKRDITYVVFTVLKVGFQQCMAKKEIVLRRGNPWTDPRKLLLEGPMLDGRVKYQLFVPNVVHIGDPNASITIVLNNNGNQALQLKSVQCTWVEVYTFEEPGRSSVSRDHTMSKVLKLADAFPQATDEVTQKFAIPQIEASPDCDHRAVSQHCHPLLKAYGGSAHVTHEVRIKVEYKMGRQVNLLLDGILARIPFNCVAHSGSGVVPKVRSGQSRMHRSTVSSSASSPSRRNSVSSVASGVSTTSRVTAPPQLQHPQHPPLQSSPTVFSSASNTSAASQPMSPGYGMQRSASFMPSSPSTPISPTAVPDLARSSSYAPSFASSSQAPLPIMNQPPPPRSHFPQDYKQQPANDYSMPPHPDIPQSSSQITQDILINSDAVAGGLPSYEPFIDLDAPIESPPPAGGAGVTGFEPIPENQLELPTYTFVQPRSMSLATGEQAPGAQESNVIDPATLPPRTISSRTTTTSSGTTLSSSNPTPPGFAPTGLPEYAGGNLPRTYSMAKPPMESGGGLSVFGARTPTTSSARPAAAIREQSDSSVGDIAGSVANMSISGAAPYSFPSSGTNTATTSSASSLAASSAPPSPRITEQPLAPVGTGNTSFLRVETVMIHSEPPPPFSEFYEVGADGDAGAPPDAYAQPPPPEQNLYDSPQPYATQPQPYTAPPPLSNDPQIPYTPSVQTQQPQPPLSEAQPPPSPALTNAEPELIPHMCNVQKVALVGYTPAAEDEMAIEAGQMVFVRSAWTDGFAYGINLATQQDGIFPQIVLFGPSNASSTFPSPPSSPAPSLYRQTMKRSSVVDPIALNRPIPTPVYSGNPTQRSASTSFVPSGSVREEPVRPVRSTSFVAPGTNAALMPPKRSGSFLAGGQR
ncbi:hypothetical protein HDU97_007762 [Phlyctochytrium planicorne]|nr:hypothetical protein HDU97_007762 [Phlyctochytrium planicorne]